MYRQAEGQGWLRQAILCDYNNKSNANQVKETVPTWSLNWLPLCNTSGLGLKARLVLGRAPWSWSWTSREVDFRELRGRRGPGRVQLGRGLGRPLTNPLC